MPGLLAVHSFPALSSQEHCGHLLGTGRAGAQGVESGASLEDLLFHH